MSRFWWVTALAVAAFAQQSDEVRVSGHAYTPPPVRLTTESRLVQLEVVVRDSHGRAVAGLQRGDFEILDEAKPRAIAAFSVETSGAQTAASPAQTAAVAGRVAAAPAAPARQRSVMLFFDDLHANTGQLRRAQKRCHFFRKA